MQNRQRIKFFKEKVKKICPWNFFIHDSHVDVFLNREKILGYRIVSPTARQINEILKTIIQ